MHATQWFVTGYAHTHKALAMHPISLAMHHISLAMHHRALAMHPTCNCNWACVATHLCDCFGAAIRPKPSAGPLILFGIIRTAHQQ